jgi:uncharacterized protein (TIGR00156 family)
MRLRLAAVVAGMLMGAVPAVAQFQGPTVQSGPTMTVQEALQARVGSYVTLTGSIVTNLRGNYFEFRDASGSLRVEIEPAVWRGRPVTPTDRVRIFGEIENGPAGRYMWVKTLDVVR